MRLIDADELIKEVNENPFTTDSVKSYVKISVQKMPTAQPEIIRCKDCKHWREGTAFSYCDKLYRMGVLDVLDYMVDEDDYCSMAERRTDD